MSPAKKLRVLEQDDFDQLLSWLDPDPENAGLIYEKIRRRLVTILASRRCAIPEELADETIDRVARRVSEIRQSYAGDKALYFLGVMNNVHHEYLKQPRVPQPAIAAGEEDVNKESIHACLDKCLEKLAPHAHRLIERYYAGSKRAGIDMRKQLATELGISINTLRLRALRIREKLQTCIETCLVSDARPCRSKTMFEDPNKSKTFSDETIHLFLLGELDANEHSIFEEHFLVDDELESRVRTTELDLADDYALAHLKSADRKRFEQNFLLTEDRKRALDISKVLHDRFAAASAKSNISHADRLRVLFDFEKPVWKYAFAVILLSVLLASVWLVTKEPHIATPFIPKRLLPRAAPTSSPREANHPPGPSTPQHAEQSPQMPPHEAPLVIVSLDAQSTTAQSPAVKLPSDPDELVRFELKIRTNQAGSWHAEVLTTNGESVFRTNEMNSSYGVGINLDVPARVLKTGAYQVRLINSSNAQDVVNYYFRVQ